jgi:hypothetical protein
MKGLPMPNEKTRAYIYRILLAVLPLLVLYGIISDAEAAQYAIVGAALLGVAADALATANTKTK